MRRDEIKTMTFVVPLKILFETVFGRDLSDPMYFLWQKMVSKARNGIKIVFVGFLRDFCLDVDTLISQWIIIFPNNQSLIEKALCLRSYVNYRNGA